MEKNTLVKLWEELLEEACDEAATGMLCDLFRFLKYAEEQMLLLETSIDPKYLNSLRDMREVQRPYLREILMELLEDEDGSELKSWYELYCDDLTAFRERARQFARDRNDAHESGIWKDGTE